MKPQGRKVDGANGIGLLIQARVRNITRAVGELNEAECK